MSLSPLLRHCESHRGQIKSFPRKHSHTKAQKSHAAHHNVIYTVAAAWRTFLCVNKHREWLEPGCLCAWAHTKRQRVGGVRPDCLQAARTSVNQFSGWQRIDSADRTATCPTNWRPRSNCQTLYGALPGHNVVRPFALSHTLAGSVIVITGALCLLNTAPRC